MVASRHDHGVQIIDITDPAAPVPAAGITDSTRWVATGYDVLSGAFDVAVSEICGGTYAVVASPGDSGLQIINITDPANPSPTAGVIHETDGLVGPYIGGIEIAKISGRTYAVVASGYDVVQIIDITDPANPLSPSAPHSTTCTDSG